MQGCNPRGERKGRARAVVITGVPTGEAPDWVREAWVGTRIPLRPSLGFALPVRKSGVLSGPRSLGRRLLYTLFGRPVFTRGYAVSSRNALAALEEKRPDAARWWRENAPHTLTLGRQFVFSERCCAIEPVGMAEEARHPRVLDEASRERGAA